MTDEPKLSVVPFTPKKPSRRDDLRDDLIVSMHKTAIATEQLVRCWETYGDNIAAAIDGAIALAEAGRWEDLEALLRGLRPHVHVQVSKKMPSTPPLPDEFQR